MPVRSCSHFYLPQGMEINNSPKNKGRIALTRYGPFPHPTQPQGSLLTPLFLFLAVFSHRTQPPCGRFSDSHLLIIGSLSITYLTNSQLTFAVGVPTAWILIAPTVCVTVADAITVTVAVEVTTHPTWSLAAGGSGDAIETMHFE